MKKTDAVGIIGLLLAIFTLVFGDNIYQQINGRSIFSTQPPQSVDIPINTNVPTESKPVYIPETPTVSTNNNSSSEPNYIFVDADEVLNLALNLKALGELAQEKYSLEERNTVNGTLTFTIESSQDQSMLWRWYWCATTNSILEQNLSNMRIEFRVDDDVISNDQFANVYFKIHDPGMDGWSCFAYETILTGWKPGEYHFTQIVIVKSLINDGKDDFSPGTKIYEYTIKINR
jgi:hypothetical protein